MPVAKGWKVQDYSMKAWDGSGRHVRKATRVIAPDGRKVDFTEKMSKGAAIKQAKDYLKRNPDLLSSLVAGAAAGTAVAVTGHHLKKRLGDQPNPTAYGQVHTRGGIQEWYETGAKDARQRASALRKLGYKVATQAMGSQVTPVGTVKMTLLDIRPGKSGDPDLVKVPSVRVERMNWKGYNPAFAGSGAGGRFAACVRAMSKRPGVRSPKGLCAAIGRRKYGAAGMAGKAAAGRKQAGGNPYQVLEVDGLGRRTRRGPPLATKAAAITRADQLKRAYPLLGFEVVVSNPAETGFSIAMVPRKGPRLVLPRVYGSKAEAQTRAGKIRRPFGTRTAIVPAARNPYDTAAAASEGFHGRPVEETIEIVTPEHHHEYLAALGELLKLEVLVPDSDRVVIPLKGFKGAWLAENEERNQLFVKGGNQSLPDDQLRRFVDVETLHETEVLGPLAAVTYHTIKYHLGEQGGDANFRHVFGEDGGKLPVLVYKVRDGLVEIAGGSYTIPDEGITN